MDVGNEPDPVIIKHDDPGLLATLSMLQGVVTRMAGNSANCKTWCATIMAALLALSATIDEPLVLEVAAVGVVLAMTVLDAYYLALERSFINQFNHLTKRATTGALELSELFSIKPVPIVKNKDIWKACGSISVWLFYGLLFVTIVATSIITALRC